MLTFSANQPGLEADEVEEMGDIRDNIETVKVAESMRIKRSVLGAQANPEGKLDLKPGFWSRSRINGVTPKNAKRLIDEKILEKDQAACQHILN